MGIPRRCYQWRPVTQLLSYVIWGKAQTHLRCESKQPDVSLHSYQLTRVGAAQFKVRRRRTQGNFLRHSV